MTTFSPEFTDLASLFAASTKKHASLPLFGEKRGGKWTWMTYREFGLRVAKVRGAFRGLGVAKGDRVAVISNNRSEWAIGAYACWTLGAVYVPMYEMQLEKDWKYILADCGAKVCLVSTNAIFDKVTAMQKDLPSLAHVVGFERAADDAASFARLSSTSEPADPSAIAEGDEAVFIYTSGTTGNPKGVRLSHRNLAYNLGALRAVAPLVPGDRAMSILPWAHAGGLCELNTTFFLGNSTGLCEAVDKIPQNLLEIQPTWLVAVPRIWHKFYDGVQKNLATQPRPVQRIFARAMRAATKRRAGRWLSVKDRVAIAIAERVLYPKIRARFGGRLRYAASGAAAISRDVLEFVENVGIPLREVYGLTETSPLMTGMRLEDTHKLGSVGRALPGVTVKLDHDVAGGDAENGEVLAYGHCVMLGYHNLPEETAKAILPDGGLRTGDLGRLDADGFLYITGRVKELYKLENGKFVAPVPIEEKICLSPYIAQAMVYGLNRPHNVALVVADMAALVPWCEAHAVGTQDARDPSAMLADTRVRELIAREIEKATAGFKGYERIKGFVLTAEEFSTENDQLTPTLKLKRRNVLARHEAAILGLYGGPT
jgi:long-chain acyl-CoA synthetase